jgi:hypothetical protein
LIEEGTSFISIPLDRIKRKQGNIQRSSHTNYFLSSIMNNIREIEKINKEELDRGIAGTSASWHAQYEKSAWVYVGNLEHELTEGDVLCIMSQYGEVSSQGGTFPVSVQQDVAIH